MRALSNLCPRRSRNTKVKNNNHVVYARPQRELYGYQIFPPPPPLIILENRPAYFADLRARKYLVPEGVSADTPLYALYRLYEYLIIDHVTGYRNQLEYFWRQRGWAVSDIPDPKDGDPARYAFLACIPALLVSSFNERIKLGLARETPAIISPEEAEELRTRPESSKKYEELPAWTINVPAHPQTLRLPSHDNVVMKGLTILGHLVGSNPRTYSYGGLIFISHKVY